jgi:dipeptidyl aminopeptidase/acylaminoacyl peptidase
MKRLFNRSALLFAAFVLVSTPLALARHSNGIGMREAAVQTPGKRKLSIDDLFALHDIADPRVSPDGNWVSYTVRSTDVKEDKRTSDIWMTSWDGARTLQLTFSKEGESNARWSPDGKYIAFLASRGGEVESNQVWLMNRAGGEAQKITDIKGGVGEFEWSPDSSRMALLVRDPDPDAPDPKDKSTKKAPKPVVIDRYQFKRDIVGYLTNRHQHLYLFDLGTRKAELLTPGSFDESAPAWSPDGSMIAFVSKRGKDPDRSNDSNIYVIEARVGATARQLTTYEGTDNEPAWSPDGKSIAYIQGGPSELIGYGVNHLAVVALEGGSPSLLAPSLDRNIHRPRWSQDGTNILGLLEDDRTRSLVSINASGGAPKPIVGGRREVTAYDLGPHGKIAFLSTDVRTPAEVYALDRGEGRSLSHQNKDLLDKLTLGSVDEINFRSKDGTVVNGFVVKPPDYLSGHKYPTLLRIHGGPVSQFGFGFSFEWQLFAAHGYVVVAANPRGSSGRGQDYSKAIYADWGNKDAQDVLAAVDYVVAQGIADPSHLGVGGWSYGGMLTNYTIAQDTRFKAAVSGASISNIIAGYGTDQYTRDYEIELGPPWRNPEKWLKISFPFLHADRITTPTLFLCGERDFNVPLLNSEQMYQALKSLGRDTELVIYPGQFHGLTRPSYVRDRYERYLAWYGKHLMTQPTPEPAGHSKEAMKNQVN